MLCTVEFHLLHVPLPTPSAGRLQNYQRVSHLRVTEGDGYKISQYGVWIMHPVL